MSKPKVAEVVKEINIYKNENNELGTIETNIEDKDSKKENRKNNFSFSIFLSYIIVFMISFFALIILIDTFKNPLYTIFPKLELILFNLFEILKDIRLFIKDLF